MEVDSTLASAPAQTAAYRAPVESAKNAVKAASQQAGLKKLDAEFISLDSKSTSDFLQKTIERVNKQLIGSDMMFNCSVHEKTGQYMIKIINVETKEVIREIPPEKTLDAVAKMWELAGLFVDKKA